MQDEDVTQAPNENEEQQSPNEQAPGESEAPETPSGEQQQEGEQEAPNTEEGQQAPEGNGEQPSEMSRRKQLRIQKLMDKMGVTPEQIATSQSDSKVDFSDLVDADDDVMDKINQRTEDFGRKQREDSLNEARFYAWRTELKYDADKVNQKYPQFDKNSDEFDPALANAINKMYLSSVGYTGKTVSNPDVSFADYVEGIAELAEAFAESKVAKTRQNITRQAAQTGLRPDGTAPKSLDLTKAPSQMSDEELQAALKKFGLSAS